MHRQDFSDLWTIREVGDCLVAAMRHANLTAGPVGPAKIQALDYSFGLPFPGGEVPAEPPRAAPPLYDPATVDLLAEALTWQGRYLAALPDQAPVEVLKLWLRAKTSPKLKFEALVEAAGRSKSAAYRDLDTARGEIARGLNNDRVPKWTP